MVLAWLAVNFMNAVTNTSFCVAGKDLTVKLSAGRRAVGRVTEQPVRVPDSKGPDHALCDIVLIGNSLQLAGDFVGDGPSLRIFWRTIDQKYGWSE